VKRLDGVPSLLWNPEFERTGNLFFRLPGLIHDRRLAAVLTDDRLALHQRLDADGDALAEARERAQRLLICSEDLEVL